MAQWVAEEWQLPRTPKVLFLLQRESWHWLRVVRTWMSAAGKVCIFFCFYMWILSGYHSNLLVIWRLLVKPDVLQYFCRFMICFRFCQSMSPQNIIPFFAEHLATSRCPSICPCPSCRSCSSWEGIPSKPNSGRRSKGSSTRPRRSDSCSFGRM